MKKFFLSLLALFFPWIILLIDDNPGGALIALVLQATGIGWIPASIWAWRVVHEDDTKAKKAAPKSNPETASVEENNQ